MIQLLYMLYNIIMQLIRIYEIALLVYFFMSWIPNARGSSLWNFLVRICEPYVGFFRRFLPPIGGISFAGILAILTLGLIRMGLAAIFSFLINLL